MYWPKIRNSFVIFIPEAEQLRKKRGGRSIKFEDEEHDEELESLMDKIDFPQFGTSPGPTPSPTPPSTPPTPSYFSVSEVCELQF